MTDLCVCNSGKQFALCCKPLLKGEQYAKTPVKLMRSRFSAFALGGYGEYLLATWSASQREGMTAAELSIRSTQWVDLKIVDKSQNDDKGVVEFKAYYLDSNGNQSLHHERSNFERLNGRWLYLSGDVF